MEIRLFVENLLSKKSSSKIYTPLDLFKIILHVVRFLNDSNVWNKSKLKTMKKGGMLRTINMIYLIKID